jgi:hypothetical protein
MESRKVCIYVTTVLSTKKTIANISPIVLLCVNPSTPIRRLHALPPARLTAERASCVGFVKARLSAISLFPLPGRSPRSQICDAHEQGFQAQKRPKRAQIESIPKPCSRRDGKIRELLGPSIPAPKVWLKGEGGGKKKNRGGRPGRQLMGW